MNRRFWCQRVGGKVIFAANSTSDDGSRLLVIEPDVGKVAHLRALLDQWQLTAITSLQELYATDMKGFEAVICSAALRDGSGLYALTWLQKSAPDVPVIMVGKVSTIAIQAIRGGAMDFLVASTIEDLNRVPLAVEKCFVHQRVKRENEQLQKELRKSLGELAATNTQLQTVIQQLETMARTDELTGLFNRRWFNVMLEGHWADATRHDLPLACLLIDLDGFKAVNDQLGHHQGDDLLRLAAKVVRTNCRDVDIPARYGGDEFCVLMGHTRPTEAMSVAERILREFTQAVTARSSSQPHVGMSIGVSHINVSRPLNANQLVSHADEAMYAAKSAGKHCVVMRQPGHMPKVVAARS